MNWVYYRLMETTSTFTVGQAYSATSVCDHECVWTFKVLRRTARFITIEDRWGAVSRVGVRTVGTEEVASPLGSYSMAPVIRSSRRDEAR